MKSIYYILLSAFVLISFGSCDNDDVDPGKTVVPDPRPYDTPFDKWLSKNYRTAYNIEFMYYLEDFQMSPTYNLIPARIKKSKEMAAALKYVWFEAYDEVTNGVDFLRDNTPRMICLVGSPAIDPDNKTLKMGSAEGGVKVLLYNINDLDVTDLDKMNEYYLRTMHHEFAHILHQKKSYPLTEFNSISTGLYSGAGWISLENNDAWKRGFVSAYGSMEPREDFAEIIAHYISQSDNDWNYMMVVAGEDGRDKINKKLSIARTWLKEKWKIDIDELKAAVQRRGENLPEVINSINF